MSNYYSKGSSAYKLEPESRLIERREKNVQKNNKRNIKKYTKPIILKEIDKRDNIFRHLSTIAFFSAIAISAFIILSIDINITSYSRQLQNMQTTLHSLNHQNSIREVELNLSINIQEIEYIAVNYLNMVHPQEFQIMNINVPLFQSESYIYTADNIISSFSFARLWGIIFGGEYE